MAGTTKFSGFALWNFALEGFTSFSTAPLKIWTYLGAVGALATLVYAVFIVFYTVFHGTHVPGYASLLVAVLFFGSVQLMSIGLLGEYIGRIYLETKQRPSYLVRKTYGSDNGASGISRYGGHRDAALVVPRAAQGSGSDDTAAEA